MQENTNTEQGIRNHDKEHLPKKVLNNEQDPNSFEDPLKKEQEKIVRSKDKNEKQNRQNKER